MDTGGDQWWVNQNAPEILAKRGYSASTVQAARRFYSGRLTPGEFLPIFMKFMSAYNYDNSLLTLLPDVVVGPTLRRDPKPSSLVTASCSAAGR